MTTSLLSDVSAALSSSIAHVSASIVTVLGPRPVSGVAVFENEVLTVAHTLHSDELQVLTPDGRTLSAQVMGRDHASDLALLRVENLGVTPVSTQAEAPAASGEAHPSGAQLGELLSVVGRPTSGLQASLGFMGQVAPQRGWFATAATPFGGVSGGGVFDMRGILVGVANAGLRRGEVLAITAPRAIKVAQLLSQEGRVPRGYLGVATQPVHFPQAQQRGAEEQSAQPTHPSETQRGPDGWRERGQWQPGPGEQGHFPFGPGRFGPGHPGQDPSAWGGDRGKGPRGQERGGWNWGPGRQGPERQRGERPGAEETRWPERGGAEPWAGRGRTPTGSLGLTVVQVEAQSPAQAAGLVPGDVLLRFDGEVVGHPRELLARVGMRAGERVTLRVLRGGQEQDVVLTLGEQ